MATHLAQAKDGSTFDYDGEQIGPQRDHEILRRKSNHIESVMNDSGIVFHQDNLYVTQPPSPYEHLNITTLTSGASKLSPVSYEELNNDVWKEIFTCTKESLQLTESNQLKTSGRRRGGVAGRARH